MVLVAPMSFQLASNWRFINIPPKMVHTREIDEFGGTFWELCGIIVKWSVRFSSNEVSAFLPNIAMEKGCISYWKWGCCSQLCWFTRGVLQNQTSFQWPNISWIPPRQEYVAGTAEFLFLDEGFLVRGEGFLFPTVFFYNFDPQKHWWSLKFHLFFWHNYRKFPTSPKQK